MSARVQLQRICWNKDRYTRIDRVAVAGRHVEQRERRPMYYYRCPFGDHWHLSSDAHITGVNNNPVNMAALLTLLYLGIGPFLAVADSPASRAHPSRKERPA
jgi:hypothetical protein